MYVSLPEVKSLRNREIHARDLPLKTLFFPGLMVPGHFWAAIVAAFALLEPRRWGTTDLALVELEQLRLEVSRLRELVGRTEQTCGRCDWQLWASWWIIRVLIGILGLLIAFSHWSRLWESQTISSCLPLADIEPPATDSERSPTVATSSVVSTGVSGSRSSGPVRPSDLRRRRVDGGLPLDA